MDARGTRLRRRALGPLAMPLVLMLAGGCAVHPKGPHGPACSTIEAATHILEYPSYRLATLKQIAARQDLSQHEQTYLVNAIFIGGFSSQVAETLITLIHNPCGTDQTRQQIRAKLKFTRMLGREEKRVIGALEKAEQPASAPVKAGGS